MARKNKYVVATRPSLLAYTQTEQIVSLLKEKNPDCEFEIIKFSTHGDKVTDKPLTEFGGTGVFVKELENAIIHGKADFAVHSLKDVPGIQPEELILASFPKREDPRDVLLIKNNLSIHELNDDCIIGTGSPRRMVQIANIKPKAQFKDSRGNIDTRLKKLDEGLYDAIVLAAAGLKRLGKQISNNSFLETSICLPAIGQGAIAIECKKDDKDTIGMLRTINDKNTEIAVISERSYMKTIGGGCKFPLAAHATIIDSTVFLSAMIGNHHTNQMIRLTDSASLDKAEELGKSLAGKIVGKANKQGLKIEYLNPQKYDTLGNKIIISTRPISNDDSLKKYLIEKGAKILDFPMIEICPAGLNEKIKNTLEHINSFNWIVFTSRNGVKFFFDLLKQINIGTGKLSSINIAVVGNKTSEEVLKNNCKPFLISPVNKSRDLLNELKNKVKSNESILLVLGELASKTLEEGLPGKNNITRIDVYKTKYSSNLSKGIIEKIKDDKYDLIIFTSPSGFRNFLKIMKENNCRNDFRLACIGTTTETEIIKNNYKPLLVSSRSDGTGFAREIENYLLNYSL